MQLNVWASWMQQAASSSDSLCKGSGGFGLMAAHRGKRGFEVHPHRLDDMAVEVLEAAAIHEAMVLLRAGIGLAARRAGSLDDRVDLGAAVARQAEQRLDRGVRVNDRLGGEIGKVFATEEHEGDRVRPRHRCRASRPGEALVSGEADGFIKR